MSDLSIFGLQLVMKSLVPQFGLVPKLSEIFKSVTALELVLKVTHVYREKITAKNAARARKSTAPSTGREPTTACS